MHPMWGFTGVAGHRFLSAGTLLIAAGGLALYQMTSLVLGPAGSRELHFSLTVPAVTQDQPSESSTMGNTFSLGTLVRRVAAASVRHARRGARAGACPAVRTTSPIAAPVPVAPPADRSCAGSTGRRRHRLTIMTPMGGALDWLAVGDVAEERAAASGPGILGGGAARLAAHAAALGARTALVAKVGSDEPGRRVRDSLERLRVDLRWLREAPGLRTTIWHQPDGDPQLRRVERGADLALRLDELPPMSVA